MSLLNRCLLFVLSFFPLCAIGKADSPPKEDTADIVIVGAGVSGITAALEAGRAGMEVTVVDMWSVFGGHAVMSEGWLCLVDTPMQREEGIRDSVALATKDFMTHGEDADPLWVHRYSSSSRSRIYDWLQNLGVQFEGIYRGLIPGNSVRRQHLVKGKGMGLMVPLYQACLGLPNIRFIWNHQVRSVIRSNERIAGVRTENIRTGEQQDYLSETVILATGGFQNNLEMVRRNWSDLPKEARLLKGAGVNAVGSGIRIAETEGAKVHRLDHQWNYGWGLVHPYYLDENRGLDVVPLGGIEVNRNGIRFANEFAGSKITTPALIRQPGATKFALFDSQAVASNMLMVGGAGWDDPEKIRRDILDNPQMTDYVKRADSIEALAIKLGMSAEVLKETVSKWNQAAEAEMDPEFGRDRLFGKIATPPFYSIQLLPITRKSFGGIAVDPKCRVVDTGGSVIPGLYAVGELTGFGGVNGRAGLEGTMLGPSILMGRIASETISAEIGNRKVSDSPHKMESTPSTQVDSTPRSEFRILESWLKQTVKSKRRGYSHFEKVHAVVLEKQLDCHTCHVKQESPMSLSLSAVGLNRFALSSKCASCHAAQE